MVHERIPILGTYRLLLPDFVDAVPDSKTELAFLPFSCCDIGQLSRLAATFKRNRYIGSTYKWRDGFPK